jgi:hypothetical protein
MSGRMNWDRVRRERQLRANPPPERTPSEWKYWLTVPQRPKTCHECGNDVEIIVFRAADLHTICEGCAERLGIQPAPSRRYRQYLERTQHQRSESKPTQRASGKRRKQRARNDSLSPDERRVVYEAMAKRVER